MKIIIAAGGTGGHIYPGIAIAEELQLKDANNQILFIGAQGGIERGIVEKEGFKIKEISARGMLRKLSWKAISAPFVTLAGFWQSINLLKQEQPDRVVATGGYVALPVIMAAKICKIPVLLHEQNTVPGITNRFCSKLVDRIALTFAETKKYFNGDLVGNPVRQKILKVERREDNLFTVLVFGGSQGARSINRAVNKMAESFADGGTKIIHVAGERDIGKLEEKKLPFYTLLAYMYNIEEGYRIADLVVSRAGATAIAEIVAVGLPSILIPFPYSSEGHQEKNAKLVEALGAAVVLPDDQLDQLADLIKSLKKEKTRLSKMSAAARKIARREAGAEIVRMIYEKY
ncbi:undecaprenyldiphospho-muramoylpentapeptide beta-N-acetylglucosaminyltransferase [Candidatus Margulisiibacteriota bacterium]